MTDDNKMPETLTVGWGPILLETYGKSINSIDGNVRYVQKQMADDLAGALEFYAKEERYDEHFNDGMAAASDCHAGSELGDDKGQIARTILQRYRQVVNV